MPHEQFLRSHISDYQRHCALTEKVPILHPDEAMAIVFIRTLADELVALLHASLHKFNITEVRMRELTHLPNRVGPLTHSELATASGVTKGTITGLVDSL